MLTTAEVTFVLANTVNTSATPPLVINIFSPLMTYVLPSLDRVALVWMDAGSLPLVKHTYTYIHTHIHTYIHTYTQTYIHTYIHTHIHTYTHTHRHTYTQTYIHTYTHTHIHTDIHTHIHTYTHTHTYTQTDRPDIQTYTYRDMI